MNNNFFKKHLVTIVITSLFGIAIIIGFYQGINDVKQEENTQLYNDDRKLYKSRLKDSKELKQDSIKSLNRGIEQEKKQLNLPSTPSTQSPHLRYK